MSPTDFSPFLRLPSIRAVFKQKLNDGDAVICPVCDQHAKIYRRKIHANMARTLFEMHARSINGWVYLPSIEQKSRDTTFLALWGLITEAEERREDGGRAGWWKVTATGLAWLEGRMVVPKYLEVYNGNVIGKSDESWSVKEALGNKFNYKELMDGV